MRQVVAVLALIIGFVLGAEAQAILTGTDSRVGLGPAGTVSVPFSFLVDSLNGEDVLDVVVDNPSAVITLIRPDGVRVTSANASSLGFAYATVPDASFTVAPLGFFSQSGTHVVIVFSPGQPSGTYQVQADATASVTDILVTATYSSSSNVRVGVVTQPQYNVGDTVVLTGLAVDGTTPILNATITAMVSTPQILTAQASLGNFQLVSQTAVDSQRRSMNTA